LKGRIRTVTKSPRIQLTFFFLLTFVIAWGAWIPAFLLPSLPGAIAFIGLFAPAIAALITTYISSGRDGVADVLGRYARIRFGLQWYALATLLMPALYVLVVLLDSAFSRQPSPLWTGVSPAFVLASFAWLMFVNSGEEIGWRGFALPRLLKEVGEPVKASLLLGIVWGLWHLPIYLVPGQSSFPYPLFLVLTVGLSFIYTALFLETDGSLLPAVLLHAGTDIGPRIVLTAQFTPAVWFAIDVLVLVVAGTLGVWRKRRRRQSGMA
jgi:membrane protease YdiL (CAAX protease family)